GYKYLGKGKIRWYKSSAAIHQQLMRNTIELKLRNQNSTIHFLSNADAYKEGFYPSVGEHPFTYVSKDDLKLGLAIIDDYGMEPSRVVKTLTREHDKERRAGKNLEVKKWMDHINILYVFTTSETRKTRFLTYLQKLQSIEEVTIGFKDTQLAIQAFAEKEGMNKVVAKKLFKRFDSISQVIKLIKIEFVTPIWEI
ncbi:MAG: hypothetical protein JKY54_19725, partial [Flavobacteriales bacterium]|nr:hypothetical protein [Flavobacteriales bacterium]